MTSFGQGVFDGLDLQGFVSLSYGIRCKGLDRRGVWFGLGCIHGKEKGRGWYCDGDDDDDDGWKDDNGVDRNPDKAIVKSFER